MFFLLASLGFRLATVILFAQRTLSQQTLPSSLLLIIYNQSIVYLYIACSLDLYKQFILVIRVGFFGGRFS